MILAYVPSELAENNQWKKIIEPYKVSYLNDTHLSERMEQLKAQPENDQPAVSLSREPFLYFIQENRQNIFELQNQLKKAGITIDHMAVETLNNSDWQLSALLDEVSQEAAVFKKRDRLADLIHQTDKKLIEKDPAYARAVMNCAALLMADDAPENLLDTGIALLEQARLLKK